MNKYWKKAVCLAAVLALAAGSLSGCSKGAEKGKNGKEESGKASAMGRYLESEGTLPEGTGLILALGKLEDGRLELLTEDEETGERILWQSGDQGESWEQIDYPEALNSANCEYLEKAVISPKGDIAGIGIGAGDDKYALFYGALGEAGQKVPIELPDNEKNGIGDIKFVQNNRLLVMDYAGSVYETDPSSGAILQTYKGSGEKIRLFEGIDDKLLAVTESQVEYLDLESGEPLDKDEVLGEQVFNSGTDMNASSVTFNPMIFAQGKEENTLFFCSSDGIYQHVIGGNVMEQVVNGELTSLGNPGTGLLQMVTLDDDSFLVACAIGSEYHLLRYTYSADTPAMPEKELRVYSLEDSPTIRQAISMYQKDHTDVYVNLEVGLTGEDGATASDALRTLNTDIMAGEGPDLLIMDGMPVSNYIQKGLLEDISDLVAEADSRDGLYENVKTAFEKDGKIYAIPLGFRIPLIQGDKDTTAAGSELSALAERLQKLRDENKDMKNILSPSDPSTLLEVFYRLNNVGWQKDDGTLKEEAVTEFLRQVKAIFDTGTHDEQEANYGMFDVSTSSFDRYDNLQPVSMDLIMKTALASAGWMGSAREFSEVVSMEKSIEGTTYQTMEAEGKKVFLPYLTAGICSKSENKDLAKGFMEALLQVEVQSTFSGSFPVNKKGFEATLKNPYGEEGAGISVSTTDGQSASLMLVWPSEEQLAELGEMLDAVDTPSLTDETIWTVVKEQGEKYLKGEQELENTVNSIMQKVNLYLAE